MRKRPLSEFAILNSLFVAGVFASLTLVPGCPPANPPDDGTSAPVFNNTADPTNAGATAIGSAACRACHPDVAALTRVHGHGQALKRIEGAAPEYPSQGTRAGVPNPPDALTWNDVSYVIGGYTHAAFFVDANGYVLADGTAGANTGWLLDFPANGTTAHFTSYLPTQIAPLEYEYDCFRCHTTGALAFSALNPLNQDGRLGIRGTWVEPNVECEACHGPGSNHVPDPAARALFVDSTPRTCAACHTAGDDSEVIVAADGFINGNTQYAELRASGGHANFNCTICHDPHASTIYDADNGIRNVCATCHTDRNMALHEGAIFTRGDYTEPLTCVSCHMPLASKNASHAAGAIVGATGRVGDVRSHIFRIDSAPHGSAAMFSSDGDSVKKDSQGRAAVTVDFVCLRCHTDDTAIDNSAFPLTLEFAAEIASRMHASGE